MVLNDLAMNVTVSRDERSMSYSDSADILPCKTMYN